LFGDSKSATPKPITKSRQTMSNSELRSSIWLSKTKPEHMIAIPAEASQRVPRRSASAPLTGEKTAIINGSAVSNRPDFSVSNPRNVAALLL